MFQLVNLRQERSDASLHLKEDIALLNDAVILAPENYTYLRLLSQLLESSGKIDQSITHLKSAIIYAPEDIQTLYEKDLSRLEGL